MTIAQTHLGTLRTDLARVRTSSGTTASNRPGGSLPEPMAAAAGRSFGMGGTFTHEDPFGSARAVPGQSNLRYENVSSIETNRLPGHNDGAGAVGWSV